MFLWNLLTGSEGGTTSDETPTPKTDTTWFQRNGGTLIFVGLLVLLVLWMFWSSRKRRKQQEEVMQKINSLQPGTRVETIGGIFGTIVEMNADEGTFILETGSEKHGKSYLCFDRKAIARIEPSAAPEEPVAPVVDEAPEFEPVAAVEESAPEMEENKD